MAINLGTVVHTEGVQAGITDSPVFAQFVAHCLQRFKQKDWGDVDQHDKQANDEAVGAGEGRLLGAYGLPPQHPEGKLWIITHQGHSTTILFPSEY